MSRKVVKSEALPKEWREMKLGDTIEVIGGGTPKTSITEYWGGDISWLTPPDFVGVNRWVAKTKKSITPLGLHHSSTKILRKGDVIFSARGTVGALAQLKKPMAFSQSNYGLRAKREFIEYDFLFYIMKSCVNKIKKLSYGAVFDTITTRIFDEVRIFLPPPSEQKAIASFLEKWDIAIEKTEALIVAKEKQFKWLLKRLISDQMDNPAWQKVKLGDACKVFNGSTPLRRKREYWLNGTISWFTINDIREQGRVIRFTNQKITEEGFKNSSLKLLPINSTLLCCTASVGEFAITQTELTTNQQFNGLVVKNGNELLPKYLYYLSSTLKENLLSTCGKTTINFVSVAKVKNIRITFPPLLKQKEIISILDIAQKEIDLLKQLIKQYRIQKRGLMQKLLTGELRVRND